MMHPELFPPSLMHGDRNEASGLASTIGGGNTNRASGVDSFNRIRWICERGKWKFINRMYPVEVVMWQVEKNEPSPVEASTWLVNSHQL